MQKVVSFDYDGTLSKPIVQEYAKELIDKGVDVWVLTFRWDELHKHLYKEDATNDDLYKVTDELTIPRHKIIFTNMSSKGEYLMNTPVIWHLDDDVKVLWDIRNCKIKTLGIQVNSGSWKNKCNRLLR